MMKSPDLRVKRSGATSSESSATCGVRRSSGERTMLRRCSTSARETAFSNRRAGMTISRASL